MRIIIAQINCNIRRKGYVLWIQLCLNICIWNRDKTWLCIQRVGGSCKSRSTKASNYVPEDFYLQLYLYPYRYSDLYPYFHLYLQIQVRRARNSLLTFCLRTYRPVFSPMPCHRLLSYSMLCPVSPLAHYPMPEAPQLTDPLRHRPQIRVHYTDKDTDEIVQWQ